MLAWSRGKVGKRKMHRDDLVRALAGLLVFGFCGLFNAAAYAGCDLIKLGTLPVTDGPHGLTTTGQINGHDMRVLIDTGSFQSMAVDAAVRQAGLHPVQMQHVRLVGAGGETAAEDVVVRNLKFGDFTVHGERLLVTPGKMGDVGLILGADVLSRVDVEIDLAHNVVRLWQPRNCEHTALAYWSKKFVMVPLKHRGGSYFSGNKFGLDVLVDGKKIRASLDTGSYVSLMSLETARSLGFDQYRMQAEKHAGIRGTFGQVLPDYVATFDTFQMGQLTVKHAKFRIADLSKASEYSRTGTRFKQRREDLPDLTIGEDFLRADHVMIANSQHILYFTYNGGQMFQRTK